MRVLIGTVTAVIAALFSSCAGSAAACVVEDTELSAVVAETQRLRAEREAIDARLLAYNRLQRAKAALAEKRAQVGR
jgi:hypothetical protein